VENGGDTKKEEEDDERSRGKRGIRVIVVQA